MGRDRTSTDRIAHLPATGITRRRDSTWVDREVAWWLDHRSADQLYVLLTEGEFDWDKQTGRPQTTALPPALLERMTVEPRWVDLRELRGPATDRNNPVWQDRLADIVSAVDGVPKDTIVGEHMRQARRTRRTVGAAITVLSLLLIAAVIAAVVAVDQRSVALQGQRHAIAQLLVTRAEAARAGDPRTALLLGEAAQHLYPDEATRSSLAQTMLGSHYAGTLTAHNDVVRSVTFSPDGHTLASGSDDDTVRLWDFSDPTRPRPLGPPLTGHTNSVNACGIGVPLVFRGDCQEPPMGSIQCEPRVAYDHARRRPKTRILGVTACDEATAFRDDGRVVAIVAHSSSHAPPSR